MPKLSIITVNLNNREGLRKTAESVVSQTYKDYEWIVIDGGSTDGSKELIKQYAEYISYWVSEPDKGIYNAMNKGIKKATGEYLQFLNSGDWLFDNSILMDVFKDKHDADILYGTTIVVTEDGEEFSYGPQKKHFSPFSLVSYTISHPSSYIKKTLFDTSGYYDEIFHIAADTKFFFNAIINNGASIEPLQKVITFFSYGGISTTNVEQCEKEKGMIIQEYFPLFYEDYLQYELGQHSLQSQKENEHGLQVYTILCSNWLTKKIVHFLYRISTFGWAR